MKFKHILLVAISAALSAQAQVSVGVGAPGGYVQELTPEQKAKQELNLKISLSGGQTFRVVDGKIYNVLNSQLWRPISGQVNYITDDGALILYDEYGGLTAKKALRNYSGAGVSGKNISALAIHVGTYNWGNTPLALWDCGKPYIPPPQTPAQIAAAQETARIAALREKQKVLEGQTNTVHWLQSQATNGDASAQCSLAEHYLNGQGCVTNREQAIYWLTQAANQGNTEASNKLSELKSP